MTPASKGRFFLVFFLSFFLSNNPLDAFASPEAAYRYNQEGLRNLRAGNYQEAISDLRRARRYLPSNQKIAKNLAIAYNNYAFYLMNDGQLRLSAQMFEHSLSIYAENPYALYNLGQVYYRLQKISQSKKRLKEAYRLAPSLEGLEALYERVKKEAEEEDGFSQVETRNFIIASSPDLPAGRLSYIRVHLEEAYVRIGRFLNHYPENKVVVLLYSEEEYKNILEGRPYWALAVFDGKIRIPDKISSPGRNLRKIIYHEYAHAVTRDIAGENCPLWLSEGISAYAEGFISKKDNSFYRAYLEEFGVIGIEQFPSDFMAKGSTTANWLYAQSYLLVDFIVKRKGYSGLRDILNYLAEGKEVVRSLEEVFAAGIESFEKEWVKYLEADYGARNLKRRGK